MLATNVRNRTNLRAIVIKAESALAANAVRPESTEIQASLRHFCVGEQEPKAEDWFSKDIQNGIGDDLRVNRNLPSTIRDSPNASIYEH